MLAVCEFLDIFKLLAIINDPLEDELVLSEGTCLIKGYGADLTADRNLLGFADEDLFLLQGQDGIVDSQGHNHGQLRRHHRCNDEDAT